MQKLEQHYIPFLKNHLSTEDLKVLPLAGDASSRKYFRVSQDEKSWVLMSWEPFEASNYPFLSVQSHFENCGVSVPQVIATSPQDGLVLLEDLGDLTLERKFWESHHQKNSYLYYKMAIDEIVKIHFLATEKKSDCTAFKIKFDTEKFMWEMNYGKDNLLLGILKFNFSEQSVKELQHVFHSICSTLDAEPKRIAHRDYHSRNLMIKLNHMRVIDFQDARLGPIQYDLVSLLKDSYVDLNEEMSSILLNDYISQMEALTRTKISRQHFDYIYELQSIQRCFKACGSFASFFHQRQDRRYLKYINGTLKRVLKSLSHFPEFKVFSDIIIDSGAIEKKYEML